MTIAATVERLNTGTGENNTYTWGLVNNDIGGKVAAEAGTVDAVSAFDFPDRSVQVLGTFGGCTVTLEGSNNGNDWATLNDPQGNPIALTSAKIKGVLECVRYVRPTVTGGDGTTAVTAILFARRG